ncbi:hypothetical protein ASD38_14350 [Caulobacter sp. Root487D2Y]|uniref:hypothetical protein n=1 Tax=Caulobacter sp. Root487D2Y TaxID=1736547 RepID=UPI0006FD5822|nr:hypothetical protein [Caulobacter sp. Root487D2Y]KQY28823.1 hypothetical protein ASD38_14350 [Caulobacter sp. Root487D2Y]
MFRKTVATAIVALICVAGPAAAQEQTPENAQKFVAQIAGLGQLVYAWRSTGSGGFEQGVYLDETGNQRYFDKAVAPLWDVSATGSCLTKFHYQRTTYGRTVGTADADGTIIWRNVAAVKAENAYVYVDESAGGYQLFHRFTLPNAALATRIAYAMEFLRVSCDATQGTGF